MSLFHILFAGGSAAVLLLLIAALVAIFKDSPDDKS